MVTAQPASSEAGPRSRSQDELKKSSETPTTDTGKELEAAHPVADATDNPKPKLRAGEAAAEAGKPSSLDESSASHLEGVSTGEIETVDAKFQRLLMTVHENRPADDLDIIRKAWAFSLQQHEGQKRASGEPYIIHPLEVGQVLAELKMDSTAIAAGLLHDAVEDTDVTSAELGKRFGDQVAHIVEGVTKLDKIKFANREDHQAENIRKMLLAMVTDVRVVIIKLADRLHNM